jgi:hypothetical protein
MKLTQRENLLLRRALGKATIPAEAETAAKAFIESLRKRGINAYDFVTPTRDGPPPRPEPQASTPPPSPPQPESPPPPPRYQPPPFQQEQEYDPPVRKEKSGRGCLNMLGGLFVLYLLGNLFHSCALVKPPPAPTEISTPVPGGDCPASAFCQGFSAYGGTRPPVHGLDLERRGG